MHRLLPFLAALSAALQAQTPDWPKVNEETLRHFQALVQLDTTNPPGNETRAVDYIRKVLDAERIPSTVTAKEPSRANLIARLKGNGSRKPLLIMGHTAAIMTMVLLKRSGIPLDRDVIFVAEAGEEASTTVGIEHLVNEHWKDIDAEICLAEGGSVTRRNGQVRYALIQTSEKLPQGVRLVAKGPAGHGSRPLRSNAVVHLARAVEKIAMWDPPMRLNDTTRYYFEKLATVSRPEDAARYKALLDPAQSGAVRQYLAL